MPTVKKDCYKFRGFQRIFKNVATIKGYYES